MKISYQLISEGNYIRIAVEGTLLHQNVARNIKLNRVGIYTIKLSSMNFPAYDIQTIDNFNFLLPF